jgi:hypothetical protein
MNVAPTPEVYVHNVREYLGLLQKHCSRIIWLSVSSVLNDERFAQKNDRILQWNTAVLEMMSTTMDDNVIYMDVFDKSLHTKHMDNVHLQSRQQPILPALGTHIYEIDAIKGRHARKMTASYTRGHSICPDTEFDVND